MKQSILPEVMEMVRQSDCTSYVGMTPLGIGSPKYMDLVSRNTSRNIANKMNFTNTIERYSPKIK